MLKSKPISSALIPIVCIVLAILPATARAQASRLYMPVLSASDSLDVGLALSNPVLESASATLIARDYSGTLIQGPGITNPKTLLLPPQSQIALLASEIFGAGISTGWVEVQLSSPDVQGFFLLFDSRISFMDGAALSSVPTNRLIFPKVTSNPSTANWLTLINTGDQAINRVAISSPSLTRTGSRPRSRAPRRRSTAPTASTSARW